MKLKDAHHRSPATQEALRYRVVRAIENGMSKSKAARVFQVSRTAVHHWTKAVVQHGGRGLKTEQRGWLLQPRLASYEAATTARPIT